MLHYIKDYESEFERDLNIPLMRKDADSPLVEYILDSWRSLQIIDGIKFLDYEYTEKESEIDINKYIYKREKGKRRNEKYDYKMVEDDRVGLLTVRMKISVPEKDFKTGENILREKIIKKSMLIPLQDENGMFYIKGKRYHLIYQMVEKSTYTSANSVILKSLMPFAIRRQTITREDIHGKEYTLPLYTIDLFKKEHPVMLIYANRGLNYALQYALESYPYVAINFVTSCDETDKKYIYFPISTKLFLKVNKKLFDNFQYVQSIVGGILHISTNRLTIDKIDDPTIWIKKLSTNNNIEKGRNLLDSLKRLLDETTKKILRVDISNKMDVFSVIRWMTQDFNELRMKDNMNLKNKRLRCNEYIASLLTQEFSIKLNRIMALGSKATIDNFREMFKFPGNILIMKMHSSGVFRFDDTINDMDFFARFKYTNKGPHSAGRKNSNSIGIRYRGIHPSFIGHIDLTVCGNSDPGTSGLISPYSKIKGLNFDDSMEPDNFRFEFLKKVKEVMNEEGIDHIDVIVDNKEDYYSFLNDIHKFGEENVGVTYVKKEKDYDQVITEEEEDLEETLPFNNSKKDDVKKKEKKKK